METKYTQGEWIIEVQNQYQLAVATQTQAICFIPKAAKNSEANATLIAAAPDLLKALEPFAELLNQFDGVMGTRPKEGIIQAWQHTKHGESQLTVEMLKDAVEAIKKAKGE